MVPQFQYFIIESDTKVYRTIDHLRDLEAGTN